ncbi:hypothetical protein Y1Q_0017465 [Alligator mississippiensis]|uniref:Uncharacterized protein n=1 Tax=Alligator mississippiensis TaxID=8496 RepID=A0A151P216_ALLMI|nr:hypothetical protein Y1Q_0017465 [Alligator mississippiensis]
MTGSGDPHVGSCLHPLSPGSSIGCPERECGDTPGERVKKNNDKTKEEVTNINTRSEEHQHNNRDNVQWHKKTLSLTADNLRNEVRICLTLSGHRSIWCTPPVERLLIEISNTENNKLELRAAPQRKKAVPCCHSSRTPKAIAGISNCGVETAHICFPLFQTILVMYRYGIPTALSVKATIN